MNIISNRSGYGAYAFNVSMDRKIVKNTAISVPKQKHGRDTVSISDEGRNAKVSRMSGGRHTNTSVDKIIALFALSDLAAEYCHAHLHTVALINIVLSMYIPLFGVFQGANHSAVPTVVATGALGMRVLITYLFRYSSFFGYTIIWWNGLFGFGLGFLISWTYYLSGLWQKNSAISAA